MKIKKCKLCKSRAIQNFSGHDFTHIFCPDCKGHYYRGEWWTRKRWNAWVNQKEY